MKKYIFNYKGTIPNTYNGYQEIIQDKIESYNYLTMPLLFSPDEYYRAIIFDYQEIATMVRDSISDEKYGFKEIIPNGWNSIIPIFNIKGTQTTFSCFLNNIDDEDKQLLEELKVSIKGVNLFVKEDFNTEINETQKNFSSYDDLLGLKEKLDYYSENREKFNKDEASIDYVFIKRNDMLKDSRIVELYNLGKKFNIKFVMFSENRVWNYNDFKKHYEKELLYLLLIKNKTLKSNLEYLDDEKYNKYVEIANQPYRLVGLNIDSSYLTNLLKANEGLKTTTKLVRTADDLLHTLGYYELVINKRERLTLKNDLNENSFMPIIILYEKLTGLECQTNIDLCLNRNGTVSENISEAKELYKLIRNLARRGARYGVFFVEV